MWNTTSIKFESRELLKAVREISKWKLFINNNCEIEKIIDETSPDYIFVDIRDKKPNTKHLKAIAESKNVTIFLTASLKHSLAKRKDKRPKISDLKANKETIKYYDEILFLYRPFYYSCEDKEDEKIFEVILAKSSYQKTTLNYNRRSGKIFNL